MKSRNQLFLAATVLLFATAQYANATTQIKPVTSNYNIEAEYDERRAYIGNRNLELKITVSSPPGINIPDPDRLTLARVQSDDHPEIKIQQTSTGYGSNVYLYNIELKEGLEPRTYKLTLEFQNPQGRITPAYIDLDVGVRSNGKLRLIESEPEPLVLGTSREVQLKFANDYVDYPVNINKIKINSTPSGIIDSMEVKGFIQTQPVVRDNVITFDPALTIEPAQQHSLDIAVKLGGMPSLQNYVLGFSDDSKLKFEVFYDDSKGRVLSDLKTEMEIKVRPNDRFLLGALIVGLLVGTGIKFYLEYLREKGALTKRGVAGFVAITMIVGLLVFLIAWIGRLQIIAFETVDLSYDKPGVIFILGCAGALSGVHYLNKWFNITTPKNEVR